MSIFLKFLKGEEAEGEGGEDEGEADEEHKEDEENKENEEHNFSSKAIRHSFVGT